MPLQLITVIHTVMIAIHVYNYKSHFPHPIMYHYISSRRGRCWMSLQDAIPLSLSYIILVLMFVVYFGG